MSRNSSNTKTNTNVNMAATLPAAMRPARLRAGLALAVAAALSTFALRAQAQRSLPALQVRPLVGALVATGDQQDLLTNAVLVGAQASYTLNSNFAVVGAFGWSPSKDRTSAAQTKVDLYQYDLGIEGRLNSLTQGWAISTRPYAAIGAGARTYDLRDVAGAGAQSNVLGYGAVGVDLGQSDSRLGVRLEARDNVTAFKGLRGELQDRKTRNDVQLAAGLTFGF